LGPTSRYSPFGATECCGGLSNSVSVQPGPKACLRLEIEEDRMKVRELMTKDVVCANPESTLEEIAAMMKTADTGAIPVVDGDELVGVITDRDIVMRCIAEGKDPLETTAEEISSEDIHTIEPDIDADEALEIMERHQVRRLPGVEGGRLRGVISIGDVAVRGDARKSGEALEGVSRGVKHDGQSCGRKLAGGE